MVKKRYLLVLLCNALLVIAFLLLKNNPTLQDPQKPEQQEPERPSVDTIQLPASSQLSKEKPSSSNQLIENPRGNPASAYTLWSAAELSGKWVANRFHKVGTSGEVLLVDSGEWSCVYDDLTGLLWEVKTADGGWKDHGHTYSWFRPSLQQIAAQSFFADNYSTEQPVTGERGKVDGGKCYNIYCDTYHYAQAFNQANTCGSANWRLPDAFELGYLGHKENYYPDIDTTFFPNTALAYYWSRTEPPRANSLAWAVDFNHGFPYISEKRMPYRIRLVADALWLSEEIHQ